MHLNADVQIVCANCYAILGETTSLRGGDDGFETIVLWQTPNCKGCYHAGAD